MNKKAQLHETWVEVVFLILFIVGLILSLSVQSLFVTYLLIFFVGMIWGRFIHERKKIRSTYKFPFYTILVGLLLGYLIGASYGSSVIILIVFLIGLWLSIWLHKKKYLD